MVKVVKLIPTRLWCNNSQRIHIKFGVNICSSYDCNSGTTGHEATNSVTSSPLPLPYSLAQCEVEFLQTGAERGRSLIASLVAEGKEGVTVGVFPP